jgi:putative DNA primase/helicase
MTALDTPTPIITNRSIDHFDANVPAEMKACPQWLCWRTETRAGRKGEAPKPTKVPYIAVADARKMRRADVTDRACFVTYEQAKAAYLAVNDYSGIAFVFTPDDPFCGVDLDDCIDPATGELKAWGREIVDLLDSYTEISPSGTGVKIFLQGKKPGARARRRHGEGEVEVYDHGRYFTVTGRRLESGGRGATGAEPRQEQLQALYDRVMEPKAPAKVPVKATAAPAPWTKPEPKKRELLDLVRPGGEREYSDEAALGRYDLRDEDIIFKASRSRKGGGKFSDLFAGDWEAHFGSQSEADSSLVFTLAYYTKDPVQIDRIFRQSKLQREKWDEKHGAKTYGRMTIDNALAKVTKQYRPNRPTQKSAVMKDADDGADRDEQGLIRLGQRCPETGRLVLSPKRTLPTAEAFVREFYTYDGVRCLHCYAGVLMAWRGNRYVEIEEESVRQQLQLWLHKALRYQHDPRNNTIKLVEFDSNPGTVSAALESVRAYCYLPAELTPTCWLTGLSDCSGLREGWDAGLPRSLPDPRNLLAHPSGTLDLMTGKVLAPTPALFNVSALDFDYQPHAEPCERWIRLLEQIWGDDIESVQLLQEWIGYCLVADTSQQKIMLMIGPKRSGKGTIGRVITRLVGAANVVGPTTSGLAGAFGLQQLIGKSLAVVSDARFSGDNVSVVTERLLCISGEDLLSVDRKFLGSVAMKLPTRFMMLTNELPRFTDMSGALAGRFVTLRLTRSFYGQEDVNLTEKLTDELPGILLWAMEGLLRLRRHGRFTCPKSVAGAVQDLEDLASPVGAFVRDWCEVGAGKRAWVDELYQAWKRWCDVDGRTVVSNRQVFGRDLTTAVPSVATRRNSDVGRFYEGIALKPGIDVNCPF